MNQKGHLHRSDHQPEYAALHEQIWRAMEAQQKATYKERVSKQIRAGIARRHEIGNRPSGDSR